MTIDPIKLTRESTALAVKRLSPKKENGKSLTDKTLRFIGDENGLSVYLREIGKTKNLTLKEEAELAVKIRGGDRRALNRLISANLKFVVSVCRNYQNQGLPLSDLINEGNLGLIRAAKRFDETKQFKFISYAVWWIRQAILQSLAEQSRIINIPLNRVGTIHRVGKTAVKMEQELCRAPSSGEISERLSLKEKDLNECLQLSSSTLSLEAPLQSEEEGQLSDVLRDENTESPDEGVNRMGLRKEVELVLATLDPREAEVVKLYFGVGVNTCYTLEEIGHRFNLTRERVRQIKEKALKRLRHISRMRKLEVYSAA